MSKSNRRTRLLLCCALPAEASPLAKAWNLKKRGIPGVPDFWADEDHSRCLLASGWGKIHQAAAVGIALAYLAVEDRPIRTVNLGLAGCQDTAMPLGELYQILKVTDDATSRAFFPDLLQSLALPVAQLITVDQPVPPNPDSISADLPKLFDMEASGFWLACQRFLPSDAIHCLKVLSDHGFDPGEKLPIEALKARWKSAVPNLISTLEHLQTQPLPDQQNLPDSLLSFYQETSNHLRLTASQKVELERALLQREALSKPSVAILKALLTLNPPLHSHERKNQFKALIHDLLES